MIDTHSHITLYPFKDPKDNTKSVLENCKKNRLEMIFAQSTTYEDAIKVLSLSKEFPIVYPFIGLHPEEIMEIMLKSGKEEIRPIGCRQNSCLVGRQACLTARQVKFTLKGIGKIQNLIRGENICHTSLKLRMTETHLLVTSYIKEVFSKIKKLIEKSQNVSGIGEVGLDYYQISKMDLSIEKMENIIILQKDLLEWFSKLSVEQNKPIVVHTRNSRTERITKNCILDGLKVLKINNVKRAVFHCFTGNLNEAKQILEAGYYLGFTNIINYPKNTDLRNIVSWAIKNYPDNILAETDAPLLPPANRRGQTCYPWDVSYVYKILKDFGLSEKLIDENAKRFIFD